jgi:UDP-N-acetylmuramyl pentapeptide phosphotransferase/UDP-N-acetylglucosamine-1-phosphate transferase
MDYYFEIGIAFMLAFVICLGLTPLLILYARKRSLYNVPNHRTSHNIPTPTLGGLPIFIALMFVMLLCLGVDNCVRMYPLTLGLLVLVVVGVLDDIITLRASLRLIIQLVLSFILVGNGLGFTSLYGFLGIYELPLVFQYLLSILFIVGVTNAFNLVYGIDGLAGGLGFINAIAMGVLFLLFNQRIEFIICFAVAGALLAFLFFNFRNARIFMGDTGSLFLGFLTAWLCLKINALEPTSLLPLDGAAKLTMIAGVVMIPAYDMLRVAIQRVAKGKSPFSADKSHIHHLFTKVGLTHVQAALSLFVVHGLILVFTLGFNSTFSWEGIVAAFSIMILAVEYPGILKVKSLLFGLHQKDVRSQKMKKENRFL